MSRYEGRYIRISDITVTEDKPDAQAANECYVNMLPVSSWMACFEGPVLLEDFTEGSELRIVRYGHTPQDAINGIQDLVESWGWKIVRS